MFLQNQKKEKKPKFMNSYCKGTTKDRKNCSK
jgi:hypothetical protein